MADTYTHKELAALCGVSETTIKSYRRKFPGFIPVLTRGKPIRFKKTAGEVCLAIRDSFERGLSVNETLKTLQGRFKRQPPQRSETASGGGIPQGSSVGGVSEEYLEKFFETAGQMMQGMAAMATAQAKANQRLERVESVLDRLVEIETKNSEAFAELLKRQPSTPIDPETSPGSQSPSRPGCPSGAQRAVRTRKIVNVSEPEGGVTSYTLDQDGDGSGAEGPSDDFLETPIVIRNDQGEFLGVPGRLSLKAFVNALTTDAEQCGPVLSVWKRRAQGWILSMQVQDGDGQELFFASTTTPRGNLVVLLERLDVNGERASARFLQEFFRQVKGKL